MLKHLGGWLNENSEKVGGRVYPADRGAKVGSFMLQVKYCYAINSACWGLNSKPVKATPKAFK